MEIFLESLSALKGQALHAKSLEFIHPTQKINGLVLSRSYLSDFMKLLHLLRET